MKAVLLREMFVPMLGVTTAVIWTFGGVITAVLGPIKKLRLPVESVPGTSRGVLNMVLFAPFVACFLLMAPTRAWPGLVVALLTLISAFICYQRYGGSLYLHRYTKPRARRFLWWQWNRDDIVFGGTELTILAAARKARDNTPEQEMLAEAEYNPDEIWTRQSRIKAQARIERWYYGFLLSSMLTVVLAALAMQTIISGEAPLTAAQRVWVKAVARK